MNKVQQVINGIRGIFARKAAPMTAEVQLPGPGRFIMMNGDITWISDKLSEYVREGYQANDIVYAAVMMVMDKVRVAPWSLYKVVDESSLKKYHALIGNKSEANDWQEIRHLRKKALEPIEKYDSRTAKLANLLKWANEYCTFNDLVADSVGYKMITGNSYIWANMLDAGANQGVPQELFNLPAQYINIKATYGWPQRVTGYQLNNGFLRSFAKEEVMHLKYFNPEYGPNGEGLYGQSPLKAANRLLKRNNSAKKAGAVQLDNNGAVGIAYVDEDKMQPADREVQARLVKRVWANEYTGADSYGKVAFSGYKMGYVPVGKSLVEMALTDVEKVDLRSIFNLWGIPSQLGNDPDNKTYNSLKEAEKALTTRCAIPHLCSFRDRFDRQLQGDWGDFKGIVADFDLDVYHELQDDQKQKWEWVKQLPVSSRYKLELMNLDVPDDPNLDVILIDGNYVPLSDIVNNMSDQELRVLDEELNKAGLNDYLRVAK